MPETEDQKNALGKQSSIGLGFAALPALNDSEKIAQMTEFITIGASIVSNPAGLHIGIGIAVKHWHELERVFWGDPRWQK